MDVPLHAPEIGRAEREAVQEVLESGSVKGDGVYTERCQRVIETAFDAPNVLLTSSCTHALEMAAILLDVDDQTEVIVPTYTFPSTATAFALRGATIRFCDVDPVTLNVDPRDLAATISMETDVVVPVHYAGVGCDMDRIVAIARDHDAVVVEDAAQGVNAAYRGEYLGTIGALGCYSFHGTKSYVAGEGGALVINDDRHLERAEIIRQKGTNYAKFRREEVSEYTWVDHGSSYVPSELQMALLSVQLERRDELLSRRRETYEFYRQELADTGVADHLRLPTIPEGRQSNYHLFHVRTEREAVRNALIEHLNERGIGAASHYRPLHASKMGQKYARTRNHPVSERAAATLVRLPVHPSVESAGRRRVVREIEEFFEARGQGEPNIGGDHR